jgi:hypothetical protein
LALRTASGGRGTAGGETSGAWSSAMRSVNSGRSAAAIERRPNDDVAASAALSGASSALKVFSRPREADEGSSRAILTSTSALSTASENS